MVTHIKRSSSLFFCFASSLEPFLTFYQRCYQLEAALLACFIVTTVCLSVERDLSQRSTYEPAGRLRAQHISNYHTLY